MASQQEISQRPTDQVEQERVTLPAGEVAQTVAARSPLAEAPQPSGSVDQQLRADTRPLCGVPDATVEGMLFLARQQPDGTYAISLTAEGVQTFETALGIAGDLGSHRRISSRSTLADLMERTATREELGALLRRGGDGPLFRVQLLLLRRRLWGTEEPSAAQVTVGRLGKILIVAVLALVALQQWAIAFGDLSAIPGILAGLPGDFLALHPGSAFQEVGRKIADAERRALAGVLLLCLSYLVASLIRPLGTIYRQDQLLPGERRTLRLLHRMLKRLDQPAAL